MLSEPPCRFGHNKTAPLLALIAKVLKMKISEEELKKIFERLCDLATECRFMHDEALVASRLVSCYCNSSEQVISHLRCVMLRSDDLLADLHCVSASLDDLLIKEKTLDDAENA